MQDPATCGTDDDYWSYEGVFRGVVEGACEVRSQNTAALLHCPWAVPAASLLHPAAVVTSGLGEAAPRGLSEPALATVLASAQAVTAKPCACVGLDEAHYMCCMLLCGVHHSSAPAMELSNLHS